MKLYSEMTTAEKAAIDADEDRREARKANFIGASDDKAPADGRWFTPMTVGDLRRIYADTRASTRAMGAFEAPGAFEAACRQVAAEKGIALTPGGWLDAATQVYWDTWADLREVEAEDSCYCGR